MTLLQIAGLAVRTVVDMAVDGKLAPGHLWTAVKGADKYLRAVAAGDRATSVEALRRVGKCDDCVKCTYEGKRPLKAIAMYCGESFKEEPDAGTCGCLVGMRVNGRTLPGGKTTVASEGCPSGKWDKTRPELV